MVTITVNAEKGEFKVTGHANYDKYGKDIVCASISTCYEMITLFIKNYKVKSTIKDDDDGVYIKYDKQNKTIAIFIIAMIEPFLKKLEKEYPDYVSLIIDDKIKRNDYCYE